MTISTDVVIRALNNYCFENIWNEPGYEYSANLQLRPVSSRFMVNNIIRQVYIPLPVQNRQFAVFWTNYALFEGSLIIPKGVWATTDTIANDYATLFHTYSETGLMLPKGCVYLYIDPMSDRVYIAVDTAPLLKIVGIANWTALYVNIYRYAKGIPPITLTSQLIPTPDSGSMIGQLQTQIINSRITSPHGTFVYVNGYDVITTSPITLHPGDYVDIYTDTTVIGEFSVDMSTAVTGYFSTKYNCYKEVLHCPKSVNPDNQILTSELLSVTARRTSDLVGVFVHRNEDNAITQITHSDVGINTSIVDAYRTSLGSPHITLYVKIRSHGNTLLRDSSFIDYLYTLDDTTIMTFLVGHGDPSLPFWTADSLEQTIYVSLMFGSPDIITLDNLGTFVSGLGYYTTASILCQHEKSFRIGSLPIDELSVAKPLILQGTTSYPLVYVDGVKLRDSQVAFTNNSQNKLLISVDPTLALSVGQTITVDMIESGASIPYLFTPQSGTSMINVPFDRVNVYLVNTLDTPVVGYQTTSSKSYTHITPMSLSPVQTYVGAHGGTDIVFGPSTYGKTYLIQNGMFSRVYGLDITDQVTSYKPITYNLTTICQDGTTTAPLLGCSSLAVYLNGRRLIEGIDFSANPITDADGNPSIVQVVICNRQLIQFHNLNYLEIIAHTTSVLTEEIGYVANNTLNVKNNVALYYPGMTDVYIGGVLQPTMSDKGDALIPTTSIGNGIPFRVVAEVPSYLTDILSSFTHTSDDNRITAIDTYLNQKPTVNNISTLIIPSSWKLYSPYVTAIIHDAIQSGSITIYGKDPSDSLFLTQFSAYDYLKTNDPTLHADVSKIDLRFCDIYPCYSSVVVPDLQTYTSMRRLASLMLPPDTNTLGEVLNA